MFAGKSAVGSPGCPEGTNFTSKSHKHRGVVVF